MDRPEGKLRHKWIAAPLIILSSLGVIALMLGVWALVWWLFGWLTFIPI